MSDIFNQTYDDFSVYCAQTQQSSQIYQGTQYNAQGTILTSQMLNLASQIRENSLIDMYYELNQINQIQQNQHYSFSYPNFSLNIKRKSNTPSWM